MMDSQTPIAGGAVAILDKYAALNTQIEDSRHQSSHAKNEIENIQFRILEVQEQKETMEHQIKETVLDIERLQNDLKSITRRCHDLEKDKNDALRFRDELEREIDLAKKLKDVEHCNFLEQCKNYRDTCKNLRLSASSLSPLVKAFTDEPMNRRMNVLPPEFDALLYNSSDDDLSTSDHSARHINFEVQDKLEESEASSMSGSVLNRVDFCPDFDSPNVVRNRLGSGTDSRRHLDKPLDHEMTRAKEEELQALNARSLANQEYDRVTVQYKERMSRSEERANKIQQQHAQLERVRKDIQSMEKELVDLDQNTKETRQMSEAFAKDLSRRKQQARDDTMKQQERDDTITSHSNRSVRDKADSTFSMDSSLQYDGTKSNNQNPYKKNHVKTHYNNLTSQQRYSRNSSNHMSALKRQHPHRAGRIRTDKQFRISLGISECCEEDEPTRYSLVGSGGQSSEEMGMDRVGHGHVSDNSDDDDDHDKELLRYAPFHKTSSKKIL